MVDRHGQPKSTICSICDPYQAHWSQDSSLFCHFRHRDSDEHLLRRLEIEIFVWTMTTTTMMMTKLIALHLVHVCGLVMYMYPCEYFCCSVQEILGYDPKVFTADGVAITDFIHPADQLLMMRKPVVEFSEYIQWPVCIRIIFIGVGRC